MQLFGRNPVHFVERLLWWCNGRISRHIADSWPKLGLQSPKVWRDVCIFQNDVIFQVGTRGQGHVFVLRVERLCTKVFPFRFRKRDSKSPRHTSGKVPTNCLSEAWDSPVWEISCSYSTFMQSKLYLTCCWSSAPETSPKCRTVHFRKSSHQKGQCVHSMIWVKNVNESKIATCIW